MVNNTIAHSLYLYFEGSQDSNKSSLSRNISKIIVRILTAVTSHIYTFISHAVPSHNAACTHIYVPFKAALRTIEPLH